jgi:serine/threonine-protein kinase
VPLLALFVGAAAAALVLPGVLDGGRSAAPRAAVAADTSATPGVTLTATDYVGRPVDDVAAQLSALGLTVQRQQDPTSDVAAGTVTRVDPAGVPLRPGDPVVVSYAVPLGYSPAPVRTPRTKATVRSTTQEPVTTTPAAPTTTPETTAAATPADTTTATATDDTTSATSSTRTTTSSTRSSATTSSRSSSASSSSDTPSGGDGG